jgi:hypothetical protein
VKLFHVSEEPGIVLFEPRLVSVPGTQRQEALVWAIEERLVHNYLAPRDCPRVTFHAGPETDPADAARLMGHTSARYVVAIESRWVSTLRSCVLYRYQLLAETFELADPVAAYWTSRTSVEPLAVERIDDALSALTACDVELRVTPSLWPLRDAVVASTLAYSCIRMKNAAPR